MTEAGTTTAAVAPKTKGLSAAAEPHPAHAEEVNAFLSRVDVSSSKGLSEAEAAARLEKYGRNRLPEPPRKSSLRRILEQFANPLVLTLLAAAVIAVVVGVSTGSAEA